MRGIKIILVLCCHLSTIITLYNVGDDVIFNFKWPGLPTEDIKETEHIQLMTSKGESYICFLPQSTFRKDEYKENKQYPPNETALLEPLFSRQPCALNAHSYWIYELCHNQHVRQYHVNPNEHKDRPSQEYYLGYYVPTVSKNTDLIVNTTNIPKVVTLGEMVFPYFEVNYTDGTECDLNHEHRKTTVMYVCHEGTYGQILDISEIHSCQYQLVFATKYLCEHPAYQRRQTVVNSISCYSQIGASIKPVELTKMEAEREKMQSMGLTSFASFLDRMGLRNIKIEATGEKNMIVYRITPEDLSSDKREQSKEQSDGFTNSVNQAESGSTPSESRDDRRLFMGKTSSSDSTVKIDNAREVREFLSGTRCLIGQTGWWTHEICFKKFVRQYHQGSNGEISNIINLGVWDPKIHLKWIKHQSDFRLPEDNQNTKQIVLYYGGGDFCKETNAPRETIVKLKCLPYGVSTLHPSISESIICQYSIILESPMFCDLNALSKEYDLS